MIDAWSGPTPTPQQFPANEPNGIHKLLNKIKALELQIKESTSNLLGTAGIRLTQLGMFIDSSLTVGGSLDVTGPMVVGGTLSLPAGIIGNDALTSPVAIDNASAAETGFATATSVQNRAVTSIPVPAGYSQAVVFAVVNVGAWNGGAVTDFLYITVAIAGVGSRENVVGVAPSGWGATSTAKTTMLTGLSGGTISLSTEVHTGSTAFAANAINRAFLEATAIFLR